MALTLTQQEIQLAKDMKAKGVSNMMIMGHIAQTRQGKSSILSESIQQEQPKKDGVMKTIGKTLADAPSDIAEGFTGVGQDLYKRGEKVTEAGEARIRGEQGFVRTAFQQLGQVAGGVGDIIARGVGTAAKVVATPETEKVVSDTMAQVAQDVGLVDVFKKLEAYKQQNPAKGRDIDATLGILELALDRVGLGAAAKGAEVAQQGARQGVRQGVDVATQAVRQGSDAISGAVDSARTAASQIQMPNITPAVGGAVQTAKDFGSRVPRAVTNIQDGMLEKAARADRIKTASPAVADAIRVNVPDNTISLVTQTDAPTRKAMIEMLDVAESGARKAQPSRVAGEAVAKQYDIIDTQRKTVGKKIEEAINNLPNATVDMRPAYKQLDTVLAENGIVVKKGGVLDFSKSALPTQQRLAIQRLYNLTKEAGDTMGAKMVHAKDRMFSAQKRADMKTDMLDDILITVNGEKRSIYDTFRDIYRNQLDNLDNGTIRNLNKEYAILRNVVDEADNSVFKTSRTMGMEVDPSASALVNLRRLEGEALSTPYFRQVADQLDTTSRGFGYNGAKPSDLITFAEDLRAIYPGTIPKAGFTGNIQTAIKPSLVDLADKALNVGAAGVKDQQKALRKMLAEYEN